MFGTLIESRPSRTRRHGSAALSAIIHLTLVAGAVDATLPRGARPIEPPPVYRDTIRWVDPAPLHGASRDAPSTRCTNCFAKPIAPPPIHLAGQPIIDCFRVPAPNWDSLSSGPEVTAGAKAGPLVDNPLARGGGVGSGTGVFSPDQVERAVAVLGTVRPAYPEMLRAAGAEGRVVVRFVVDTTGHVEPGSVAIIESTHALFERSVRDVLPRLRFAAAEVGGRHVRQLVEMPFQFSLSNR